MGHVANAAAAISVAIASAFDVSATVGDLVAFAAAATSVATASAYDVSAKVGALVACAAAATSVSAAQRAPAPLSAPAATARGSGGRAGSKP